MLEEKIAEIIYTYAGGLYPEDHIHVYGKEQEKWEDIPEWMRDDYRLQAKKVLDFVIDVYKIQNEMEASIGSDDEQFELRRKKKRK